MSSRPRMYADLHCHPTLYSFNRARNHPIERDPKRFHPWEPTESNLKAQHRGARANVYTQCTFPQLAASRTRLVFASITPVEKGFLLPRREPDDGSFVYEVLRLAFGRTLLDAATAYLQDGPEAALKPLVRILRNDGPLRQLTQQWITRFGFKRIAYMVSHEYDYWEEFEREYDYMLRGADQPHRYSFERIDEEGQQITERGTGCYRMVKTHAELKALLDDEDSDEVAVVLSIEGGHTFSIDNEETRRSLEEIVDRIETLRELEHPMFFVTLAHHFDNGICGHAHSIIDAGFLVMDQRPRMHEDLDAHYGDRVIRELLDLDEDLHDRGQRRILIDVKHMSAASRRSYYNNYVEPYNARPSGERGRKIPVIMSHAGYAGVPTLEQLIRDAHLENNHFHHGAFYAWNINACDDDIRAIHASGGLFGLCFDKRICGIQPNQRLPSKGFAQVAFRQICAVVDVIMQDDRLSTDERRRIWDCICIGTDFDGLIDPLNDYPTTMEFDRFADDLLELLEEHRHTRMIDEIGAATIVEKIAYKNAYDLVLEHYPVRD